jgi:hypothetical protein
MSAAGTTTFATGLEAAIAAGVIDRATAERLAPFLAGDAGAAPSADPDDERLRLITGFNDIFVTIGLVLFLGGLGYVLSGQPAALSGLVIAAAAWGLAEFFTRVRRMALPSIVLLVVFVASVFFAVPHLVDGTGSAFATFESTPWQLGAAGLAAAAAALLHWLRFHVPVTVAAGVAALAVIAVALSQQLAPNLLRDHPIAVFLPLGLAIFALAMWFDASDRTRQTRRTDIAFWLHLLAAPIIVHPILLAVSASGDSSTGQSALVVGIFLVLGVVALIVDRRAILVSSLSYLAYAAGTLISASGLASSSYAPSALAVGAVVLLLSAAWRPLRRGFVRVLPPGIRQRVPVAA